MGRMPININNLTLDEFVNYNKCLLEPDPDFAIMREFLGLTQDQIDEIPFKKLNLIKFEINLLRTSKLSTRRKRIVRVGWRFRFAFRDFNTNQFTALDTYTFPDQANYIAAVGYGYGKFNEDEVEKWAKRFRKVKIGKVSGQVFFCTQLSPNLNLSLGLSSLQARTEIKNHLMREVSPTMKVSKEIMDGILS